MGGLPLAPPGKAPEGSSTIHGLVEPVGMEAQVEWFHARLLIESPARVPVRFRVLPLGGDSRRVVARRVQRSAPWGVFLPGHDERLGPIL